MRARVTRARVTRARMTRNGSRTTRNGSQALLERLARRSARELGHVTRQHALQLGEIGSPGEGFAHVAERRGGRREKPRILLHAIDEDETARVLELALNGEEVEHLAKGTVLELRAAQERHEVVLARAEERVLELDDALLARRKHHEVARLVVAVGEPLRLGVQRAGDPLELAIHHLPLGGREGPALPRLEQPLAEVVELPEVEVAVERPRERDARRAGSLLDLGGGADAGELVDGALVERLRPIAGEEARLEHLVAEVLEDHEAAEGVVPEEGENL